MEDYDSSTGNYNGAGAEGADRTQPGSRIRFRRTGGRIPVLTYTLIAVNILVWGALMLYSFKSGKSYNQLLFDFGAKENAGIISGQFWRLLTPVFLHADIVHLALNCYSLFAVGIAVESIFGRFRFTVVYFIAGIIGNIASFMFSPNMGVGASGAIFGLLGALLYFGVKEPQLFKAYLGYNVIVMIVINLGYGFSRPGIDNFAHIGGLVGGFAASGAVSLPYRGRDKWYHNRLLYVVLVIAIAASGLYYGFNNKQNRNLAAANEIMSKLKTMEQLDKEQKWSEVEKSAEEIIAMEPEDKDIRITVLWSLARAEALQDKYEESIVHAGELAKVEPGSGHYLLGVIYYGNREYDKAKQELEKAKKLNAPFENIDELLADIENA